MKTKFYYFENWKNWKREYFENAFFVILSMTKWLDKIEMDCTDGHFIRSDRQRKILKVGWRIDWRTINFKIKWKKIIYFNNLIVRTVSTFNFFFCWNMRFFVQDRFSRSINYDRDRVPIIPSVSSQKISQALYIPNTNNFIIDFFFNHYLNIFINKKKSKLNLEKKCYYKTISSEFK